MAAAGQSVHVVAMAGIVLIAALVPSRSAVAEPRPAARVLWVQTRPEARASLTLDGPWLDRRAGAELRLRVRDDRGARIRFVESFDDLELLFYVERDGLKTCTLPGAVLYPSEAAAAKHFGDLSPGVRPEPGTCSNDAAPARRGLVKLKLDLSIPYAPGHRVEARGYVPEKALGQVFVESDVTRSFSPDATLPGNYRLLDAPAGAAFVFSASSDRREAQKLGHNGRYTLVRTEPGAVGWIASSSVQDIPSDDSSGDPNGVEGGMEAPGAHIVLPVGTVLRESVNGQPIGEVTGPFVRHAVRQDGGWSRFDVDTRFGTVAVWAQTSTPAMPASAPTRPAPRNPWR